MISHPTHMSLPVQSGNPKLSLMQGIGSNTRPDGFSPVSPSMACTRNTGPPTEPNWDAYCRDFNYTMRCKATVERKRHSDTCLYPQGVSWSEFMVNLQEVQIHLDTGTISPWYCERFDYGVILNHLICLDVSTMDMEAFLAGFSSCGFDHTRQKYFELQFLAY
jgi:hypothetical protein